jgi:hypothetical protein
VSTAAIVTMTLAVLLIVGGLAASVTSAVRAERRARHRR